MGLQPRSCWKVFTRFGPQGPIPVGGGKVDLAQSISVFTTSSRNDGSSGAQWARNDLNQSAQAASLSTPADPSKLGGRVLSRIAAGLRGYSGKVPRLRSTHLLASGKKS